MKIGGSALAYVVLYDAPGSLGTVLLGVTAYDKTNFTSIFEFENKKKLKISFLNHKLKDVDKRIQMRKGFKSAREQFPSVQLLNDGKMS